MISSTRPNDRLALRFCVLNHRTRGEDGREVMRFIVEYGRQAEIELI